jgi:hypothetical protein
MIFLLPIFALRAKIGSNRWENTLLPQATNHASEKTLLGT